MTPEELRSLTDEATPGQWKFGMPWKSSKWADEINRHGLERRPPQQENCIYTDAHVVVAEGYGEWCDGDVGLSVREDDARLIALAPDLARLCAELGEALIPARDLLANDLEREEDGGYRAVLEVVDEALAKLSELNNGAEASPTPERT